MIRFPAVFLGTLALLAALHPLAAAEPARNFARWEPEVAAFEAQDRAAPPPKGGLLFIGSSTIRFWSTLAADFPGVPVINRGFGGTHIEDATHFADRLVFPHQPRAIFLRAGGNDLHDHLTPAQVAADFQAFVAAIHARLPAAEIYFISLCPTIARWSETDANREANALVAEFARQAPRVHYIDTWTMSLDDAGQPRPELFRADKLHFSPEGYRLLVALVRPFVAEAAGKPSPR